MVKKKSSGKYLFGLGDLMDRLSIVNIKISILESVIKDEDNSNAKAGKAAKLIRKINTERTAIRNLVNRYYGHGFEDFKVEDYGLLEETKKSPKRGKP